MTAVQFGLDRLCKHHAILRECRDCNPYGFEPHAPVRHRDPATSHAAAKSVTGIRHSQQLVLSVLQEFGPLCDEAIGRYQRITNVMSASGARTRRAELVAMGLVVDSGKRVTLPSGRKSIVWRAQ